MKAFLIIASVIVSSVLSAAVSQAKSLECTYEAFNTRTGQDIPSTAPTLTLPIVDETAGATSRLQIGKFDTYNVYAWQLNGAIVVAAEEQTTKAYFSSTGSNTKVNLRLQTGTGIYETFCQVVP